MASDAPSDKTGEETLAPPSHGARPIDSHCHLQSLEPDERAEALESARARGIRGFLVPCIELDDAPLLIELCESNDDVWCSIGVHPHSAKTWKKGDARRVAELCSHPKVVAVGECGLDFYYDNSPRDEQERAMREQWEVALDLGLPVIVHNRDSNEKMLEIFRHQQYADLVADFHSFAGGKTMAEELLERDTVYLGYSGMVTFKRAENIREVLPITPDDRLLVETDSPYLAPVPHRGQPNRPAYVMEILERVAEEVDSPAPEVADQTSENFFRLFPKAAG